MSFVEKQILDICKRYGINVVKKKGYPLYMGKEMDENFSVEEIMRDSDEQDEIVSSKERLELSMPVFYEEENDFNNSLLGNNNMKLNFKCEKIDDTISSKLPFNNENIFAA